MKMIKMLDWRKTGLKADRKAALRIAVEQARLNPTLSLNDLKECAKKTIAKYNRRPW